MMGVIEMYIVPLSNLPTVQSGSAGETSAQSGGLPFREVMRRLYSLCRRASRRCIDTYDLAYGNSADLHTIMIHSAMETTAVETVVQLTSRAVSAYKEIMQMQI